MSLLRNHGRRLVHARALSSVCVQGARHNDYTCELRLTVWLILEWLSIDLANCMMVCSHTTQDNGRMCSLSLYVCFSLNGFEILWVTLQQAWSVALMTLALSKCEAYCVQTFRAASSAQIEPQMNNFERWITRLVCRWRVQPIVWINANCRTLWASTSWTHIAIIGKPVATPVWVSAYHLSPLFLSGGIRWKSCTQPLIGAMRAPSQCDMERCKWILWWLTATVVVIAAAAAAACRKSLERWFISFACPETAQWI